MSFFPCKICGKLFERVGNGVYCNGPHYRPCPRCGKPVEFSKPSDPIKFCSKECKSASMQEKIGKKIGPRKCEECGKIFYPRNANQRFCDGPHKATCVICGNEFEFDARPGERAETCSRKCQTLLQERTNLERTGYRNPSLNPESVVKMSETHKKPEVIAKTQATMLERHNVTNFFYDPEFQKRVAELQRDPEFKEHRYDNYQAKTGFACPMNDPEVVERRRQTNRLKGGMDGAPHSREDIQRMMVDGTKVDEYLSFREDPQSYIQSHYTDPPAISTLEHDLGVTNTPIYNVLIANNCSDMILHVRSSMENEVVEFLLSLDPNLVISRNTRTVIKPLEIDIYLPDHHIGFECNPAATHNSSVKDPWGSPSKPHNYHQLKSKAASDKGIFIFHIFGYEWVNRRNVVCSMIRNLLGYNSRQIGARETYVCELSNEECKAFLDSNHRQGGINCKLRLGLRLKSTDELVSVMTFGGMRFTLGRLSSDSPGVWELSRFCNLMDTSVSGSASKLFKYFLDHYHPDKVISFSDIAHTRGNLYSTLGFKSGTVSEPSYVWTDIYDNQYYNRVSCQKHNLRKLLKDDSIDIENNSEREIMESHKFVRVYDCGTIRWEYQPSIETKNNL